MLLVAYVFVFVFVFLSTSYPDSKVHWANIGPILVRQDPGGPHVGPTNFAIRVYVTAQWDAMRHCIVAFGNNFFGLFWSL